MDKIKKLLELIEETHDTFENQPSEYLAGLIDGIKAATRIIEASTPV